MNSIFAILFVIAATIIGKWLLFDDDNPSTDENDESSPTIRIADTEPSPPPLSKSA